MPFFVLMEVNFCRGLFNFIDDISGLEVHTCWKLLVQQNNQAVIILEDQEDSRKQYYRDIKKT